MIVVDGIRSLAEQRDGLAELKALLHAPTAPRIEWWQADLTGRTGSCQAFSCSIELQLGFARGLILGEGRGLNFPHHDQPRAFEADGTQAGAQVSIDLYSHASFLRRTPIVCSGTINQRQTRIVGHFSIDCFTGCGCGGGTGDAVFRKIEQPRDHGR